MKKNTLTVEERRTLLLEIVRKVLFMPDEDELAEESAQVTITDQVAVVS